MLQLRKRIWNIKKEKQIQWKEFTSIHSQVGIHSFIPRVCVSVIKFNILVNMNYEFASDVWEEIIIRRNVCLCFYALFIFLCEKFVICSQCVSVGGSPERRQRKAEIELLYRKKKCFLMLLEGTIWNMTDLLSCFTDYCRRCIKHCPCCERSD